MSETREITIQGLAVAVTQPYAAGQTITEAEAKALNQVRAENIRNNQAKLVKEAIEKAPEGILADETIADLRAKIAEYDAAYVFTLASVGAGRKTTDPVEAEARRIARALIGEKLKEKGIAIRSVAKEKMDTMIATAAASEKIIEAAKKAIAARSKAGLGLDDLDI